jgi:chromosome partitioning protein
VYVIHRLRERCTQCGTTLAEPLAGDLVGIFEIAEMAGVSRQAVANWRARFADFPAAVAELRSGPIFHRQQVRRWLRKRKVPMANVISIINLKGGVGKTTTCVALAEFLAALFTKRVLVIDLDPQTNATITLIDEDRWKQLNDNGHTIAQLFKDALNEPHERKFDLQATRQVGVSSVGSVRSLDLIPSSLDLIDVQDRLGSMSSGRFHSDVPTDILRRAIRSILDEYDYVFIDCPPNLGIITLNGLRISTSYIIPTIPDVLSTYGIDQILSRVTQFSDNIGESIEPLGIVVSKYRAQSPTHNNTIRRLRSNGAFPRVFETVIKENDQIAASAEYKEVNKLRQKYGYQGQFDTYNALTKEIIQAVEGA